MNNKTIKLFPFIFLILLSLSVQAAGLSIEDSSLFEYANHLYEKREYYRAISEYKKIIYFFPESSFKEKAMMQIGKAYLAGNQYKEAIKYWDKVIKEFKDNDKNYFQIKKLLGLSWLNLDQDKPFVFRKKNIKKAIQYFSEIKDQGNSYVGIKNFLSHWQEREEPEYKSPWLAGSMSAILPGSGSFYAGRPLEGTYAFMITGLFYLAAMDCFREGKAEAGYFFSFFSLAFYGGNIYTAVNSAHKINNQLDSDQLYELRRQHGLWFINK